MVKVSCGNSYTQKYYIILLYENLAKMRRLTSEGGFSALASVIGLIFSISGLFLPWAKREWIPGIMVGSDCLLGVELALGQFALIGCVVTTISLLRYRIRNQRYSLIFVLLGGLITMFCSLAWIINPGVLTPSGWPVSYRVLYGTYISLIGGIVISSSAIFNLLGRLDKE